MDSQVGIERDNHSITGQLQNQSFYLSIMSFGYTHTLLFMHFIPL